MADEGGNSKDARSPTAKGRLSGIPTPSPSSKRSLSYDYWKPKRERSEQTKKTKLDFDQPQKELGAEGQDDEVIKIAELKAGNYFHEKIKMRVTLKKIFEKTHDGETTQTMAFYGMDSSGEIAGVVFNSDLPAFKEIVQVNKCLELKNFIVQPEPPAFRSVTGNQFQLRLNRKSTLTELENSDDLNKIPYEFVQISEILAKERGSNLDCLGVVVKNWGLKGEAGGKRWRNLTITDQTGKCIQVTLFNHSAVEFGDDCKLSVAFRRAVVDDFNNIKCLNTYNYTSEWKNPDVEGCKDLMKWFEEFDQLRDESDSEGEN